MKNLFNSSIFDTFVKTTYGLGPLHGEPLTFSILFLNFPSESATTKPSKVQEETPQPEKTKMLH
ncbi:hypothetical protein JHK84_043079 [Glycine max]|nr:hypothetical protein JHK84_043079 [Glycine max]